MPVIFAIQNAEAAFNFGYSIGWTINQADKPANAIATTAGGTINEEGDRSPPPDAVSNIWYASDSIRNTTVIRPGRYRLNWGWQMSTCLESGSRTIIIQNGGSSASGTVHFTIVGDGSGSPLNLTEECPVFQDRMTADRATAGLE
ncbi:hypothetical protein PT974_09010 [Cladobotryum mycophilum]|uniref:DUF7136 domain-containing protein n=1 Tax=Cladobotryum mycophilum TaxID=491253 RepID=A0ABR0SG82_9HYPO